MNDMRKVQRLMVKALRRDAKKLETVARHLRQQAKQIADDVRRDERAEHQRANFYSKTASIDSGLPLVPNFLNEGK